MQLPASREELLAHNIGILPPPQCEHRPANPIGVESRLRELLAKDLNRPDPCRLDRRATRSWRGERVRLKMIELADEEPEQPVASADE